MNANQLLNPRRWVLVLATAFVLAAMAASAPVWLDNLIGTALTPQAYACPAQGGGCG